MLNVNMRVIGKNLVDAKLLAAAPRILALNQEMVKAMLTWVQVEWIAATPLGPGRFESGRHLRDSSTTDTRFEGIRTVGVLKSPATGYWREFGTQGSFHKGRAASASMARAAFAGAAMGSFGERAFMVAHRALNGSRRIIKNFYSGAALWWRA